MAFPHYRKPEGGGGGKREGKYHRRRKLGYGGEGMSKAMKVKYRYPELRRSPEITSKGREPGQEGGKERYGYKELISKSGDLPLLPSRKDQKRHRGRN